MTETVSVSFQVDDRLWLAFLVTKAQPGGHRFRIGRFCEEAVRRALPQPDSKEPHSLGEIWEIDEATKRTRAFRCAADIPALLKFWEKRLGIQRQVIIATAIRRAQEREGLVLPR